MVPHPRSVDQGTQPGSDNGDSNSMLANLAMVSSADGDAGRLPSGIPALTRYTDGNTITQLQLSNCNHPTPVGRMEGLRSQLRTEAISEAAINLILASWQKRINTVYTCSNL